MQVDLEAPDDLLDQLLGGPVCVSAGVVDQGLRAAVSIGAPGLAVSTRTVELDPERLPVIAAAIWEWWRRQRHLTRGPFRVVVHLRSGVWGAITLRPSTRPDDISGFLTTLTVASEPGARRSSA